MVDSRLEGAAVVDRVKADYGVPKFDVGWFAQERVAESRGRIQHTNSSIISFISEAQSSTITSSQHTRYCLLGRWLSSSARRCSNRAGRAPFIPFKEGVLLASCQSQRLDVKNRMTSVTILSLSGKTTLPMLDVKIE